jgi:hypothetical protein
MVMDYYKGLVDVTLKRAELRLKQRFESLKDEYIAAMTRLDSLKMRLKN